MTTIDSNVTATAPDVTTPEGRLAAAKAKMKANRSAQPKKAKAKAKPKSKPKAKAKAKAKTIAPAKPVKARADSKQARFIAALRTAKGMSITEAAKEFDWQPHTVRGAVAGALKKKLGLKVVSDQDEKRGTVYRIK